MTLGLPLRLDATLKNAGTKTFETDKMTLMSVFFAVGPLIIIGQITKVHNSFFL